MAPRMGVGKRGADLPEQGLVLDGKVSKNDLLEIAWDMASLLNEAGSCDDHDSTTAKLIEMINVRRAASGRPRLK